MQTPRIRIESLLSVKYLIIFKVEDTEGGKLSGSSVVFEQRKLRVCSQPPTAELRPEIENWLISKLTVINVFAE